MIEDVELDEIEKLRQEKRSETELTSQQVVQTASHPEQTAFSHKMDEVKQQVLSNASESDEKFITTVVENVKDAAVKYTKVEQKKAELEQQRVQYESEKLDTQQMANVNQQLEDKWINRQKRREYHYSGVKPIMTFVGINEPMNLIFLYFLTVILLPFFLLSKLWKGTIGAMLCGAEDSNRSKAAKGFIWTIIAIIVAAVAFCSICLFLEWRGVDVFRK